MLGAARVAARSGRQDAGGVDDLSLFDQLLQSDWRKPEPAMAVQATEEPLLRLNVETRGDAALLETRTQEISDLLRG